MRMRADDHARSMSAMAFPRRRADGQCRVGCSTMSRCTPWQATHCRAQYSEPPRPLMTLRTLSSASQSGHRVRTEKARCLTAGSAMNCSPHYEYTRHFELAFGMLAWNRLAARVDSRGLHSRRLFHVALSVFSRGSVDILRRVPQSAPNRFAGVSPTACESGRYGFSRRQSPCPHRTRRSRLRARGTKRH